MFWSLFHLEIDVEDLALDEFAFEGLRSIGGMVEGAMKPVLRKCCIRLELEAVELPSSQDIESLDLGGKPTA